MFCHVPTGSSKSLRYAALPFVFDFLRAQSESPSTVVVYSVSASSEKIVTNLGKNRRASSLAATEGYRVLRSDGNVLAQTKQRR